MRDQLCFGDNSSRALDEQYEDIEGTGAHSDRIS
jgi:hypothetical protein